MTTLTSMPASSAESLMQPLSQRWVERLFERLTAQLGAKMADLYAGVSTEAVQEEWADGLAGFKPEEIARGLKACQTRQFAPTLGEFTGLCRPALDPELAWMEAADGMRARAAGEIGEWSHPAVYRAATHFAFELASKSFRECRKTWAWRLEREFAKGWGEDVPGPMPRLAHQEAPTRPPTAAEREAMSQLIVGMRVGSGVAGGAA